MPSTSEMVNLPVSRKKFNYVRGADYSEHPLLGENCFFTKITLLFIARVINASKDTAFSFNLNKTKGCNSKNVSECLNLWQHLGDGVSYTRPESQIVPVIFLLERFHSWTEFKRLHHQCVAREWETHPVAEVPSLAQVIIIPAPVLPASRLDLLCWVSSHL